MTRRRAFAAVLAALVVLVAGRAASAELTTGDEDYDAIVSQLPPQRVSVQTIAPAAVITTPPNESSAP